MSKEDLTGRRVQSGNIPDVTYAPKEGDPNAN